MAFLLGSAKSQAGLRLVDADGRRVSAEDIFFEEAVLFYNPAKSRVEEDAYLAALPYEPKKGLSREFLAYFATFLTEIQLSLALDALMDFLADRRGSRALRSSWNARGF